jgi:uncharacterized protein (DUF1697 family)
MNTFIALLRAINVGGHRKIRMDDLSEMFTSLGYENIKTYIQSGNVIFSSPERDVKKLAESVETEIETGFGHDVPVMIRTQKQFEKLINRNPFEGRDKDPFRLYVTFFKETPPDTKQNELKNLSSDTEIFDFVEGELFSLINKKTGKKEMFSNNFVEKVCGTPGTSRNWNSVNKILDLMNEI